MPTTDHDPIDFTFADDGDLVRKAPKAVPEDPVEKRLATEVKAAPHIAEAVGIADYRTGDLAHNRKVFVARMEARGLSPDLAGMMADAAKPTTIEIRHGSGKVKV